jgi:hypothetical protein
VGPPTNTSIPTSTPTFTPTYTLAACDGISTGPASAGGSTLSFSITNNSGILLEITAIRISWPGSNGDLLEIQFGGQPIYNIPTSINPLNIPADNGWVSGGGHRKINNSSTKSLTFVFSGSAASSGYSVRVTFDNGCNMYVNK